jgi:hypothetical protein
MSVTLASAIWCCLRETDFRVVAIHNAVPAVDTLFRGQLLHPHPQSPLSLAAKSQRLWHVDDLRATPPYLEGNKGIVMMADAGGVRTFPCVPLLKKTEVAGVIVFIETRFDHLPTAAQAVIAIENARLLNDCTSALATLPNVQIRSNRS